MSELDIQQILSSRFRTSGDADKYTINLMQGLGLSTKANVAKLAIGRSLSAGMFDEENIDAKGLDIPATSLFSQQDIAVWVGLIVEHARKFSIPLSTMEHFRGAVRHHWHRGAIMLMQDWQLANENYDTFLHTLINRRAELPDSVETTESNTLTVETTSATNDYSGQLIKALSDIGVTAEVRGVSHGPRVSRYRVFLPDINLLEKLKKGLERLSLVMSLQAVPTIARGDEAKTVFLDIPRDKSTWLTSNFPQLKEWVKNQKSNQDQLIVYPAVDVMGEPFALNLTSAPHLLVGGATGMGKSVCVHALIISLLLAHSPSGLKLALIDPKQVEFSAYKDSPYLYGNSIAVDTAMARLTIQNLIDEMESRYSQFSALGVANIAEARLNGGQLPFIVVFIEEMADLVMQDKDIESLIVRLAQKARAAGIHLVLATQRPDAKTFSGLIRSNIPSRIALTVQRGSESTIILDETGAENLLGAGDMLIKVTGRQVERAHGVFLARSDIDAALKNMAATRFNTR